MNNDPPTPEPTRIVADSDVLAADLFVGGPARECLDQIRAHSWLTLVASDALLDDAEAVVRDLADDELAADWREKVDGLVERVDQPEGDHPALASAYRGGAMHVLSFDERLTSVVGNRRLRGRVEATVRPPDAFATLFDPAKFYPGAAGGEGTRGGEEDGDVEPGEYPGPDRDPRG